MITTWSSLYRPDEGTTAKDRAIIERACYPRTYRNKDSVPRWAGAEFQDGYRDLPHWRCAWWVVLDRDAGATCEQIIETFGEFCGFAHTTWSSTPELLRWRIALRLDRTIVDRDEFDRVWRAAAAHAEAHELTPDYGARDASRCWALPARRPGYQHVELTGAFFDVDDALERFPKQEPLPEPAQKMEDDLERRITRASKYIAKMPGAISGSAGHAATFAVALKLVRGFALPPAEALRVLVEEFNPRCAPPWSLHELRHKIRQAYQRARVPFGFLADRRRTA